MKLRGSSYLLIIIMVIMLVIICSSLRMEYFESKLLPLVIGSIVFILTGVGLSREIWGRDRSGTATTGDETGKVSWRRYLASAAWIVGFVLAIYLLGFLIAIPLFILSYMKTHGTRWFVAIIFAVLVPVFIFGLFELVLRVDIYEGLVFNLLGY